MSSVTIKRDGFANERHVVLPPDAIHKGLSHPVVSDLLPTAIGHFPTAAGHLVRRTEGIEDAILILCVEGRGWCRFDGHTWRLQTNRVVAIPAGIPHAYGTTKRRPWSIYWVHLRGAKTGAYLEAVGWARAAPVLPVREHAAMVYYFEDLYRQLRNGYSPSGLLGLSTGLAYFLGQLSMHRGEPYRGRSTSADRALRTIDLMQQQVHRRITIGELAHSASLSIPHYTTLFKQQTGCPPIAFFLRMKMQEACQALGSTDRTVKEIAHQLGMDDPYYFSRQFKQVMGVPPAVYRRHYREGKL